MEGQLLYCTYLPSEGSWKHTSIPISQEYIDSANSTEPRNLNYGNLIFASWDIVGLLVEELSKLCGKHGAMEGWRLHSPGDLENIYSKPDAFGSRNVFGSVNTCVKLKDQEYGAKVILTRQITPSVPEVQRQAPKPTTRGY